MGTNSKIAWTNHTLNFWTGCNKVSEGCANCYMVRWAMRCGKEPFKLARTSKHTWNQPVSRVGSPSGPFKWKAGDFVFVNSLSDFFHEKAPEEWRTEAASVMWDRPDLIFLVLTKRPENMGKWAKALPSNVWIGVTAENQRRWDERVPYLYEVCEHRTTFVSAEPLIGPIAIRGHDMVQTVDWVIVGGESGPNWRRMRLGWAEQIMYDCAELGIPYFLKQLGGHPDKRERMDEWPEELRVQQMPGVE
jgi:protein gp37